MTSLKQKISNIKSYIKIIDLHIDKLKDAIYKGNFDILDHYRVE